MEQYEKSRQVINEKHDNLMILEAKLIKTIKNRWNKIDNTDIALSECLLFLEGETQEIAEVEAQAEIVKGIKKSISEFETAVQESTLSTQTRLVCRFCACNDFFYTLKFYLIQR